MDNVKLFIVLIIIIGLGGCISYSSKEETTSPQTIPNHDRVVVDPD